MLLRQTKALVLKRIPYSEGDWIVTLLTEEGRRLSGFAPAARKSQKRFNGAIDVFNLVEIIFREKEGRGAVTFEKASVISVKEELRRDLTKFAVACFLAEFILEFLQENEKAPALFGTFTEILEVMNGAGPVPDHWIPLLEHHFLDLFGFKPALQRCLDCGAQLKAGEDYYFNGMKGGILCAACAERQGSFSLKQIPRMTAYPLSYSVIAHMLEGGDTWRKSLDKNGWQPQEVNQARKALEFFIQYTAGKPLKSLQFLSKILNA